MENFSMDQNEKTKTGNNQILLSDESGIVNVISHKCYKNVSNVKNVFQKPVFLLSLYASRSRYLSI